jgi:hypothetical protein
MRLLIGPLLAVACVFTCSSAGAAEELQAGAAKVDITPPTGYAMWGYGARHDTPCVGVHDPLLARALVLAVGPTRIALVSLDLGRAPVRQSTAAIRQRVKESAGITHIFLVASHTHHGPVIELDNWPSAKDSYARQLERKLGDVIIEASKKLEPARVGVAARQVAFNRNRHSKLADKPVDRELLVLRVEDARGQVTAHAINFAAHPTMHDAKLLQFSADYPGALAALVEKETAAPCLFLQGAAGDLSANPGEARGPDSFGAALGREVLQMAKTVRCAAPAHADLQGREDDFRFRSRVDLSNPGVRALYNSAFFPALVDFYEQEYRDGVRPHLTTALLDESIGFVGVSGEFFCSHALELKRRARLDHLFFLGYCNDYQQYFPTIEAAAQGGYGADQTVAVVEVGAGEQIMNRALMNLYKMRGKLREVSPGVKGP